GKSKGPCPHRISDWGLVRSSAYLHWDIGDVRAARQRDASDNEGSSGRRENAMPTVPMEANASEDHCLYSPRVRHRRQMKRDDSFLDHGLCHLYSFRHHKSDSENMARRESRYEAPSAGIAAAAPSPTELMSADGANACTASTTFDGLDQATIP
ncbi:hypothetical protein THAOC_12285, partial [Thalassiosira oceanica]